MRAIDPTELLLEGRRLSAEDANGLELRFRAKGGFRRNVLIEDKQLARFVKACAALKARARIMAKCPISMSISAAPPSEPWRPPAPA